MKIYLLDDCDALGRYIAKFDTGFRVYCVDSKHYQEAQNIDSFFHTILTEKAWRLVGVGEEPAQTESAGEGSSLLSLTQGIEDGLFLINANLKARPFSARQHQDGVELLKHIRLTEELGAARNLHAVLYSFEEQLELLKRKPGNLILLSGGVTFHRLPECLPEWMYGELSELAKKPEKVGEKDFQRFVQCDYQSPDDAHSFSNWWGVRQLVEAANTFGQQYLQMPNRVENEIRKLDSKRIRFLYWQKQQDAQSNGEPQKIYNSDHRVLHIDDEPEWSEVLESIIKTDASTAHFRAVNAIHPNIARNDDNTKQWVNGLLNVNNRTPNLVLLDLRLYRMGDAKKSVKLTSGAIVAETIRQLKPGIPIILMTASNKAWVFEEMMNIGVDAYWMKEGIGDHLPPESSIDNYRKLKKFISKALGAEYQFLLRVAEKVHSIEQSVNNLWWEAYTWNTTEGTFEQTTVDKAMICSHLKSIVLLLREYLHLFTMGYGFAYTGKPDVLQATWLNALLMEAARVVELIHNSEGLTENQREDFLTRRGDSIGRYIYRQRSRQAAHADSRRTSTTFSNVREVISGLMLWMQIAPNNRVINWNNPQSLSRLLVIHPQLIAAYNRIQNGVP